MAVPARKVSKTSGRMRRTHYKIVELIKVRKLLQKKQLLKNNKKKH